MFVYKIQVNPVHSILKYGIYYDFMIGNCADLKSSSQWQLKEYLKKLIIHGRNLLILKIHLNAIDWNFSELHHYLSIMIIIIVP